VASEPNLDEFSATRPPSPAFRRSAATSPPWSPRLELDEGAGELTTGAVDGDPDWDSIFRHWNLDPALWEVVPGSLRVNAWEGPSADGARIFRQYRANVVRRRRPGVEVDETLRAVARWRPRKPPPEVDDPAAWVVAAADWQVGGHGGHEAFLDRFRSTLDGLVVEARRAVKGGARQLVLAYLGDMVEGVAGNYSSQTFEADLTVRDQVRVVRQCETALVKALAPMFDRTTVVAIAGNHGRTSMSKTVITSTEDSFDLMAADGMAEALTESGMAAAHAVEFVIPTETAIALVDAAGTKVLLSHGDAVSGSADAVRKWWERVSFTRWGDADVADVLVTGHRHHLRVEELAVGRTFIVAPTLGGESRWFAEGGGGTSLPGTLTFSTRRGEWWGLEVVRP
jgi:UDP-2,3-diacylglucosamine pyrophosphatase LpxH